MTTIPIIFAIDDNVVVPCGVTITSLLMNARQDTFYDIYILCEQKALSAASQKKMREAFASWPNCKLSIIDVGDAYADAANPGRITKAAYFRLMIPVLFPQFDKAIYSDCDIVYQQDLSALFVSSFPNNELLAAVLDLAINDEFYFESDLPSKIGLTVRNYFNSGFLLMNLKQLREENKVEEFNRLSKQKFDQNDQDVLNIVCNGRVQWLPSMYNFQTNHYANYMWGRKQSDIDFTEMMKHATLHYTFRNKPWCSLECSLGDAWWHYYRQSPMFDNVFYFKRQYDQIEASRNDYHNKKTKPLLIHLLGRVKKSVLGIFRK